MDLGEKLFKGPAVALSDGISEIAQATGPNVCIDLLIHR